MFRNVFSILVAGCAM